MAFFLTKVALQDQSWFVARVEFGYWYGCHIYSRASYIIEIEVFANMGGKGCRQYLLSNVPHIDLYSLRDASQRSSEVRTSEDPSRRDAETTLVTEVSHDRPCESPPSLAGAQEALERNGEGQEVRIQCEEEGTENAGGVG